jgi:hypothetical protein
VAAIAAALAADGGHLVLAVDSLAIAQDAARLGLISPDQLATIAARVEERRQAEG